jgi:hypothetical protein
MARGAVADHGQCRRDDGDVQALGLEFPCVPFKVGVGLAARPPLDRVPVGVVAAPQVEIGPDDEVDAVRVGEIAHVAVDKLGPQRVAQLSAPGVLNPITRLITRWFAPSGGTASMQMSVRSPMPRPVRRTCTSRFATMPRVLRRSRSRLSRWSASRAPGSQCW